jgi:hypothetical protein
MPVSPVRAQVLGALYVFAFLGDELFRGGHWAAAEAKSVGWPALAILWTGVVNCITCLPMSKFTRGAYVVPTRPLAAPPWPLVTDT